MERIVEIISKDKRYRRDPYPSRPALHTTWNVFLTGQHVVPGDNSRKDFLTTEEMRDPSKVSAAKLKKFPPNCIINPDNVKLISHRRKLNLTPLEGISETSKYPGDFEHPEDKAFYEYILEREFVARSEEEYVNGVHYFFIKDAEKEAVKRVTKKDLRFNAESFIRNDVPISKYREIAMLLNYKIKNFNISVDLMSETGIKDRLLEACERYPEVVLACNAEDNPRVGNELFILRVIDSKFIESRNGSFYDGPKWLGATVDQVIDSFEKDETLKAKFSMLLSSLNEK